MKHATVKADKIEHIEQLNEQLRSHLDSFKWSEEACEGILQLIDQGASPNVHSLDDVYRRFPLTMIACYGSVNQLQHLLRYHTLDLNVVNVKGHTALHKVVTGNMNEVLRIAKLEALLAPMPHNRCGPIQVDVVGISGTPLYASTVLLPSRNNCSEDVDNAQEMWIQVSKRLVQVGANDAITEMRSTEVGQVETQDHLIHQLQHWCPPVPHALAQYMAITANVNPSCVR